MKICAQCGTKIGKKDRFCNKCGSSVFNETSSRAKYCLYCGTELEAKAKFCIKCGKQCTGGISLSFLDEKEQVVPENVELDFLKSPEQLAKEAEERKAAEEAKAKEEALKKARAEELELAKKFAEEEKAKKKALEEEAKAEKKRQEEEAKAEKKKAIEEAKAEKQRAIEEAKAEKQRAIEEAKAEKQRADEEKKRQEEEARAKKEEEERIRREEEDRIRQEEERKRKEEEERLRKEEEERRRKEEEERLKKEEEERLRIEAEEKFRREEEERLRKEEEERRRKEEEERKRKEEERKAKLNKLCGEAVADSKKALAKYEKDAENSRNVLEAALDKLNELYSSVTDKDVIDLTDADIALEDIEEILGVLYYEEGSLKLAMPLIKDAAKRGNIKVRIYLGEWYLRNRNEMPKEDFVLTEYVKEALLSVEYSNEQKIRAYSILAKAYHDGIGTKRDLETAFTYYEKGAELDDPKSFAKVGQCYLYGEGIKKDGKKALEWSLKAANAGNETGIRNTAVCYDFGTGVKKDAKTAVEWYKKLLDVLENDRFAMYRIAYCLANPDKEYFGKTTDEMYEEAFKYAEKAQNAGEENANYILGYLYATGKGVARDYNKAASCYKKAANVGNAKAKDKLAMFTKNGAGNYSLKQNAIL